jgi:hypothetical protein
MVEQADLSARSGDWNEQIAGNAAEPGATV